MTEHYRRHVWRKEYVYKEANIYMIDMLVYTGFGSKKATSNAQLKILHVARKMDDLGYFVRTGDAVGADQSFRLGASRGKLIVYTVGSQTPASVELMLSVHPNPEAAKRYFYTLGRNPLQLLGNNLDEPSDMAITWTPGGKTVGGSAVNILLCQKMNIPLFNLYDTSVETVIEFAERLKENKNGK